MASKHFHCWVRPQESIKPLDCTLHCSLLFFTSRALTSSLKAALLKHYNYCRPINRQSLSFVPWKNTRFVGNINTKKKTEQMNHWPPSQTFCSLKRYNYFLVIHPNVQANVVSWNWVYSQKTTKVFSNFFCKFFNPNIFFQFEF